MAYKDKKKKKEKYLHEKNGITPAEAKKFLAEDYVIDVNKRTRTNKNPRFTK